MDLDLLDAVMALPVWDTHTHLDVSPNVAAKSVWDIIHYFWFQRELVAAGYPADADLLPDRERIERFFSAFEASRNTSWNWVVRRIFRDLFDAELAGPADIAALNERLAGTSSDPGWPAEVCRRIGIRRIVTGMARMETGPEFGALVYRVPHYHFSQEAAYGALIGGAEEEGIDGEAAEGVGEEVRSRVKELADAGFGTMRTETSPFEKAGYDAEQAPGLVYRGNSPADVDAYLGHVMLDAMSEAEMRLQLFVGMKRDWKIHTMLNDPARIVNLYPIFDGYPGCTFEIVNAADQSNMDILQAARVFTNVCPGGLWWFDFRAGTYRAVFQQRLEALPSNRSCIIASDARCVEWEYGKVLLVKRLLAGFLEDQIRDGWIDRETAVKVAADWLHDTAAAGYR